MNSKRVTERTPYNDKRINTRREYHTLKVYAPNIGASKYVNQILPDIKGKIRIIVGDFNQASPVAHRYRFCLQCRSCKLCGYDPWVRKIPWRKAWQHTLVFLPGERHGQRSQAGYSSQCCRESDTTEVTGHACRRLYHSTSINGEILKSNKPTDILNATIEHLHLVDVYRTLC